MSSKSRRKAIAEKIGSPTKLGHIAANSFVVIMGNDFVTDWSKIYQVGILPSVYFNNTQRQHWGGRVLVNENGNTILYHNSHKVREVHDVHHFLWTSPTVQAERERQAKEVAERIAREKAEQEAAAKKAAEDKEAWELATKIGLRVTGHFEGNREDALKEIDRMIALYRTTYPAQFIIHFERDSINVPGRPGRPWLPGVDPWPIWFDPDHSTYYTAIVRDIEGNLVPRVGSVEIIGRNAR